jgi:sulfopyruvate decarboxylase alpha subunit
MTNIAATRQAIYATLPATAAIFLLPAGVAAADIVALTLYAGPRRSTTRDIRRDPMIWSEIVLAVLKDNDVRFVAYVPDNILTPLITGVATDRDFVSVGATREDEAIGAATGAYMAGLRAAVMMQTSGFALVANALGSLVVPYQIPAILIVSERGSMGEFNVGQTLVARTMRPTLDALGIMNHTLADASTLAFILDKSIKQAFTTRAPVAFILSPLLTGGNPAAEHQLR